jgi:tetratricopeptide (TPR) repeat protein
LKVAIGLHRIATNLAFRGEQEQARLLNDESLEYFRRTGFKTGEAQSLNLLGTLELRGSAPERALDLFEWSIALFRETGFAWGEKNARLNHAEALFALERPAEAARASIEALELSHRMEDRVGMIDGLALLSRAAVEQDDQDLAGRLWGAIEAEAERAPIPEWQHEREKLAKPLLARAGPRFRTGMEAGRELSLDDAVATALESSDA